MSTARDRTFVGFGFGAIQAGLFALEAHRSGRFRRLTIAEIVPEVVAAVRASGGLFRVNVAHADRIEVVEVGPVELLDPRDEADRERLVDALAVADEVATAVPSIAFYEVDGAGSLHRVIARGLERRAESRREPLIVYAAENHNDAAAVLRDAVLREIAAAEWQRLEGLVAFVDTVIGKMSGVITDPAEVRDRGLTTVAPGLERALLVEAFHRILVSRPRFASGVRADRGLELFVEKDDLAPFEEAKLWGHNAAHALGAYLAAEHGLETMDALRERPSLLETVRGAFLEESGGGLLARHRGVDPLFTPDGFRAYVDDLVERMTNPFLGDRVDRVARDPLRKLGWNDRLIGPIRIALDAGLRPHRFARGVLSALRYLDPGEAADAARARSRLAGAWAPASPDPRRAEEILRLVDEERTASAPL